MKVKIQTMLGDIIVRLYDETPIHRDNFMKTANTPYSERSRMVLMWLRGSKAQLLDALTGPLMTLK